MLNGFLYTLNITGVILSWYINHTIWYMIYKREKDSWCITVINYVTVRVSNSDHVDAYFCSYNMKYTGVIKSGLPLVEPISCVIIQSCIYFSEYMVG